MGDEEARIGQQHGAQPPRFQQTVTASPAAITPVTMAGLQAVFDNDTEATTATITASIQAAIQPIAAKVDLLFADYIERHNEDACISNLKARHVLDQVKWLLKADGQLPRLSGETPRELPKIVQQLQELVEVDLDDLNGEYEIILDLSHVAAHEHRNRKMAALKRHLLISF
jgi:hypothetical protein